MSTLFRTFHTRIDDHPALGEMAALHGRVERRLHAALKSGRRFTGDLAVSFYQQFGISAKTLDGIYRGLKAKLKSVSELAKVQASDLETRISEKRKQITNAEKKLRKARKADDGSDLGSLRRKIHQHKRRLGTLAARLDRARQRVADPRICFGSAKLFNAQHHLEDNGYADHAQWLKDWRAARSSQFFIEGDARPDGGNHFVRLVICDDGTFNLELRLPEALAHRAERRFKAGNQPIRCVDLRGLRFPHGDTEIREALAAQRPLSYRFSRNSDGSWSVAVMVRQEFAEPEIVDFANGALGVDLNADHVALTLVDACGNPVLTRRIDLVTYGKSKSQRSDMIRKAAAEVAKLAAELGVPVVAEKLDFARKRAELESADGERRARMLSSFAFSTFGTALSRACVRNSIRLVLVSPTYTSTIGRVKFAPRYGLSVHAAAALSIAGRWAFPNVCRLARASCLSPAAAA